MGQTEGRQETDEAGGTDSDPAGGVSGRAEITGLALSQEKPAKSTLREYAETLVIAVVLALLIRAFLVQAYKIPSGSMIPTLDIGDHILVNKFIHGIRIPGTDLILLPLRMPRHGDVIVFKFPKDETKDFIKRVVGLPGDVIEVKDRILYRNGERQEEPYVLLEEMAHFVPTLENKDNFGPVTVPPGAYFVMGDHRDHSLDSRFWGFVDFKNIRGKAFLIYWSWDSERSWVRWERLGMMIR